VAGCVLDLLLRRLERGLSRWAPGHG